MGNFSVVYNWNNLYRIKKAGEADQETEGYYKKKIG